MSSIKPVPQFALACVRIPFKTLSAIALLAFIFFAALTSAQVVVTPSAPPYNIQVLPGSNRQIDVNITGGSLNTVNWSVLSTTGGASATFTTPTASNVSTVTAGLPTVQVNIGSGTGNCSIPEAPSAIGTYTVVSTATVTVQAQSVDDPTKSGTFLFDVCAKTTTVMVAPAYQQAFMGQHRTLQSWVSGDTDETGTWSIVTQAPNGGNGVLADTTNRDTDFVATVTGRYVLKYTSHSNSSMSATAIVYVSPNSLPTYPSTPNKTEPRECYVDPALSGGDYEVGAGKQYPSLESTPTAGSLQPGSIIRVWNTDTTGSNPSTYHEYYQITATGTATQPMILCGVPDSLGNLPVIDGSNATGQASVSSDGAAAGAGIISVWPAAAGVSTPYGFWQDGSAGPSYVTITGLHVAHGTPNYSYTPPGGGSATPYGTFTACLNVRSGSYIDLGGNNLDTCSLGVYTADNGNSGWVGVTQLVTMTGNHVQNAGITNQAGEHGAYIQTWYALLQGNLFDNYNPQALGDSIKWRGVEGIFRYNNVASGAQRIFDLVEVQDATPYITFDVGGYLSTPGDTNCNDSFYCLGDTMGPNILAGYQESFQKDFVYGNEMFGLSALQQVHYMADTGPGIGMQDRNGTLYYFSNTLDQAQIIFDTASNGNGFYGFFPPRIDARNNIFWTSHAPYNGAQIQLEFADESTIIMNATTNLITAGTFTITPPIEGALWEDNTDEGWSNTCDGACQWPLTIPIDPHLYGLSNANYLTTATLPYNSTTMMPPAGSAAINAGTALTGILQTMPVRWEYYVPTNSLIPRLNPQTIGAVDYAAEAVTPTFSPTPGDYTTAPTVTLSTTTSSASIYYTTDGSTPTYPVTGTTQLYNSPITVAATETVQAIAEATGYVQSSVGSAAYGVGPLAATPVFSLASGTYTSVQSVTITDSTTGSKIYYTTDGTTPTPGSTMYSGAITASSNITLQAIAAATGYSNSNVESATYIINIPQTATPFFSPAAGTYTGTQSAVIASTTPSSTIYYTTNGSTPTTASTLSGSSPISVSVSATETLEAIAVATGYSNSAVGSAAYTINSGASAPAYVQACDAYTTSGTITCTLPASSTAGDTIVIGLAGAAPNPAKYSINGGTLQTLPAAAVSNSGDSTNIVYGYVLANIAAGTYKIQMGYPAGDGYKVGLSVIEFSNLAASPIDQVTNTSSTTNDTALTSPSFNTASANDMLWGLCGGTSGGVPTVETTPVSFTSIPNLSTFDNSGGINDLVEYGVAGAAGSYTVNCTTTGTEPWSMITIALLEQPNTPVVATPSFSPGTDTYSSAQTVTISDSTAGATIYYTTNGSAPTTASTLSGSSPVGVTVSATETLEAIGVHSGDTNSPVGIAEYIIGMTSAATPGFNPVAGTYSSAQSVTLSDATTGATIYYTTNGSTPTTNSSVYSSAIAVSVNETLEAIATASGYSNSPVGSAAYEIEAATPGFNPVAGTYSSAQSVTLSDATSGATIYYTTNGSTPTTNSSVYSSAISVSVNETLEAMATASGYTNSPVGSAAYAIEAATPGFNPVAGTYSSAQSVTLSDATTGATIYYTTNGSTPTTNSSVYSSAIAVSVNETLEAIATASGYTNSPVGSAAYAIKAAMPGFSPSGGSYSTVQTVTITDSTAGATIYYTTNSTTPSTSSSVYSGPITVPAPETLEAVAIASGYSLSAPGTAIYTYPIPSSTATKVQACANYINYTESITCTLTSSVLAGDTVLIGIDNATPATLTSTIGTPTLVVSSSGGSSMYAYIISNATAGSYTIRATFSSNVKVGLSVVEYSNVAASPVDTTVSTYISGYVGNIVSHSFNTTAANDMLWALCEGPQVPTIGTAPITWVALPSIDGSGVNTVVEDGLAGAAGSYTAQCNGEDSSESGVIAVALLSSGPQASTPTFSPASGDDNLPLTVTISTTTPSSTIYYTTNGTTPTTSSTVYSVPINVAVTETVEAIAVSTGYANSAVGSATY